MDSPRGECRTAPRPRSRAAAPSTETSPRPTRRPCTPARRCAEAPGTLG
jgi:hypothetical protein